MLGLIGGYLAYPRPTELALIRFKNQQYTAARAGYETLLQQGVMSVNVVLPLAELYLVYGEMDKALVLMENFVQENPGNIEARLLLSEYYRQARRPQDYMDSLEKQTELQPSEQALRNLSRLYNTGGRYHQQLEVLKRIVEEYEAKPHDYLDLAYLLAAEGARNAATEVLRRLAREHPAAFNLRAREFLVTLFLDLERYDSAIAYVQGYGDLGGKWAIYYERALAGANRYQQLIAFWERQLLRPDLSDEEREAISYRYENRLRQLGREDERLAFLQRQLQRSDLDPQQRGRLMQRYETALHENGRWQTLLAWLLGRIENVDTPVEERESVTHRYESLLHEAGRRQALFSFWEKQLKRTDLSGEEKKGMSDRYAAALQGTGRYREQLALLRLQLKELELSQEERRALAFRALQLGDKPLAERVFLQLAADAPAESAEVSQLLYLWGPHPGSRELQWLEKRAREARGEQRLAWLRRLLDAGAPERALRLSQQVLVLAGYNDRSVDFQIEVLQRKRDYARLRPVLARAIDESQQPAQLFSYMRFAGQAGFSDLVLEANDRLLALAPDDPELPRRLGSIAYRSGLGKEAFFLLGYYLERNRGDAESNFYYAELLTKRNEHQQAQPYYRQVIELLAAEQKLDVSKAVIRAQALYRLGEYDNAIFAYRKLLSAEPDNPELRADFAAILIETGHAELAADILTAGGGE